MATVSQLPTDGASIMPMPANPTPTPTAPAGQNPYDQASDFMGGAGDIYQKFASGGALENINSYLNPYYDQVITNTLGRMETDRNKSLNLIGDRADASGAFGGGRHGLAEGEFLTGYNQNVGDMTSNLLSQGWDQASGMARQDMLTGAGGLQNLGGSYYQIGNDISDRQMQAGNMQQQLMQQLLTGGAQQYQSLINSPNQMLGLFQALLGGDPRNQSGSMESSVTPGLFDYLSLGAGVYGAGMGKKPG